MVDWCKWNRENQKNYLIFLKNLQCMFKIKFSENVSVNYALGISVIVFVYNIKFVVTVVFRFLEQFIHWSL